MHAEKFRKTIFLGEETSSKIDVTCSVGVEP
jgi:hypothetical protein